MSRAPLHGNLDTSMKLHALVVSLALASAMLSVTSKANDAKSGPRFARDIKVDRVKLFKEGQRIFRFDTFGDEAFWGDELKLHLAIAGAEQGGVGAGLSPRAALALGLKVDVTALPDTLRAKLRAGRVNLDDRATTLTLLRLKAIVGLTGFFDTNRKIKSVGIQCALCRSVVDDSFAPGVGRRLDGWPNRDLNVGVIISLSPDLSAFTQILQVDEAEVRRVLNAWGPGKFDAELVLDGKGFRPDGKTAATLIPPAYGLQGVNLHTWTGWGAIPHWNAFVAVIEMHGKGRFFDPRLNDPEQFPVAARNGFGDIQVAPEGDLATSKLPALHYFQLSLPAPTPRPGKDFNRAAAQRGEVLFIGKADCNRCHTQPLWTEPGWNLHMPAEIGIDDFQANRAPDKHYRTAPLAGIFSRPKGGFYHDGRFATLLDVINHYNTVFTLALPEAEKQDLVEYLKSL